MEEKMSGPEKQERIPDAHNRNYLIIAAGGIVLIAIALVAVFVLPPTPVVVMNGDNVSVYYTLKDENGTVIGSNVNRTPEIFTVGGADVLSGFSNSVLGMKINEEKTVIIPFDQAYGPYRNDRIRVVNRTGKIANETFRVGQYYSVQRKADNTVIRVRILNVTPSAIIWDENNPLAGKNLTFTVRIVDVKKGQGASVKGSALPAAPTL